MMQTLVGGGDLRCYSLSLFDSIAGMFGARPTIMILQVSSCMPLRHPLV